jgi:MFS family permease
MEDQAMTDVDSPERDARPRDPSSRSLLSLDVLNFFLADVRDGMGPFLGTFLREVRHWDAGQVGMALAASQLGTVLAQTPAGALVDRIRWKRLAIGLAAAAVAAGCIVLYLVPTPVLVVAAQAEVGAATLFGPAIAAVTLGLVGRQAMPRRTGRNEAFNHAGNVVAAALAGGAAYCFGYGAMFGLVATMAAASAVAVLLIREQDIDHDLARGADDGDAETRQVVGIGALFQDRRIVIFIASCVLFHFANAAMLSLAGQKSSDGMRAEGGAAVVMSACIIAAQVVMVPVALAASRLASRWGRKPVFLLGFAVLPVRGLLYCLSVNPIDLVAVQLLDGIGAGIFGVVSVLIVADLTKGTGRFNLTQGALATATGIGAGLSNLLAGFVVKVAGFDAGFITLAAIAAATVFFALVMPETARSGRIPLAAGHTARLSLLDSARPARA